MPTTRQKYISVVDVGNFFLTIVRREEGDSISNMKLQKLVYYAQGYSLALNDEPLFPEKIKAWRLGPVVPELWAKYTQYGSDPIPAPKNFNINIFSPYLLNLLNEVWMVYGQYSTLGLSNLTHEEPPWKDTPQDEEITFDVMKKFFKSLIE